MLFGLGLHRQLQLAQRANPLTEINTYFRITNFCLYWDSVRVLLNETTSGSRFFFLGA